jgi:hypothetical protein
MMVKSTCININILKKYARALENIIILLLSSNVLYFGKVTLAARTYGRDFAHE